MAAAESKARCSSWMQLWPASSKIWKSTFSATAPRKAQRAEQMESSDYLNLRDVGFADLSGCELHKKYGKIVQLTGNLLEAEGLEAAKGDICRIVHSGSPHPILAEVVGFESSRIKLSPLTHLNGVRSGSLVQVLEVVQ